VIGELPTVEVPVKTGTVFVVPLPVTVCAAAPTDANTKPKPSHTYADFVIFPDPLVSIVRCSRLKAARTSPRVILGAESTRNRSLIQPRVKISVAERPFKACGAVNVIREEYTPPSIEIKVTFY
jgi:hypothetical protein